MQTKWQETSPPAAGLPVTVGNIVSVTLDTSLDILGLLVDELSHGVMVVNTQGWILHANRVALSVLQRGSSLSTTQGGLKLQLVPDPQRLAHALGQAASGKRNIIRLQDAGGDVTVAVVPLNREKAGACDRIALFFSRQEPCTPSLLALFAQSKRLTRTEEQVLLLLCRCLSAPEIAIEMNVAASTVRSHVRSLCAKTSTRGVRQLVNLVAALPPLGPTRLAIAASLH